MGRYESRPARLTGLALMDGPEGARERVLYASEAQAGHHALVIGDPGECAVAVTGTPAELAAFLDRAGDLVGRLLIAAHPDLAAHVAARTMGTEFAVSEARRRAG